MRMTNIILAHDDIDFYHDAEGKKGDLKDALHQYDLTTNEAMATVFGQLFSGTRARVSRDYNCISCTMASTFWSSSFHLIRKSSTLSMSVLTLK